MDVEAVLRDIDPNELVIPMRHKKVPSLLMRTRVAGATAVQAAVRASMTRPATITLCYGLGGPKVDRSIAGLRAPGDRDGRINVAARHWRGQDTRFSTCVPFFRSTGWQPVCFPGPPRARGCQCPSPDAPFGFPGLRSLDADFAPPSMAALVSNAGSRARAAPRCPPVAQVFNLCVFPVPIGLAASSLACAIPEGGAAGSEARAEAGNGRKLRR